MTSMVAMTMTIIAIFAVSSNAASIGLSDENLNTLFPSNYGICPTIETADVNVIFNVSDSSTVKSSASFNFKPHDETLLLKSFRLKFNRLNNGKLRSSGSDDTVMEILVFPCLSPPLTSSVDSNDKKLTVMLYGRVTKLMGKQDIRCAMYQMVNSTKYLMAVSSDKSCDGLPQMLSNEQRGLVNWLLPKDESKINLRPTRSASDTKNSIKNFSGSRFFWRTG